MESVFDIKYFHFPYEGIKFPGQHSEEKILFITREGILMLQFKLIIFFVTYFFGLIFGIYALKNTSLIDFDFSSYISTFILCWTFLFGLAYWWIKIIYRKNLFIITTRRLTKFIHTTPWTRYQMSLGLDKIVDTGAYKKGFLQMIFNYGYFVARSAAGAIKNFKIMNISFAEDLHNYVNKLLFVFNEKADDLDKFRPFIPNLKGEARDNFVLRVAPQYGKPLPQVPPNYQPQPTQNESQN